MTRNVQVGLAWLTTTDFLVAYGSATVRETVEVDVMVTKKVREREDERRERERERERERSHVQDKPVTWTRLPELSYCSRYSPLRHCVTMSCR